MSILLDRMAINETVIELVQGDITEQDIDAIVNAANRSLLGGGGVDGAIFAAAGYEQLLNETRQLGGCEVGNAKITKGYNLKARHIIHAVGPRYGQPSSASLLASAYRRSLEIAVENGITTIAFPAISTGNFGYPSYDAAVIALSTVCEFVATDRRIKLVRFVLIVPFVAEAFGHALRTIRKERGDVQSC
jgi:O-acetyl-ADP-ribose deacetylase (regulator of RNase III)